MTTSNTDMSSIHDSDNDAMFNKEMRVYSPATPTPPDFRALCAELLKGLDENRHPEVRYPGHLRIAMADARAALNQPEPVGPTLDDVVELCAEHEFMLGVDGANEEESAKGLLEIARAVLARWGCSAIEPIPVSKRLPGPEDCGPGGICWLWDPIRRVWHLTHFTYLNPGDFWLPYHALLIPRSEEK